MYRLTEGVTVNYHSRWSSDDRVYSVYSDQSIYVLCVAHLICSSDAAHRILPLAGQGVNLGFGDVISLVHWLEEAVSQGNDIGSPVFLQEYTSDRQRAVVPVAATMELLNLLYSTDALAVKIARIVGYDQASSAPSTLASCVHQLYARVLTTLRSAGLSTVQSSTLTKVCLPH
ncbi:unnamed protein product [Echinostoma caproni]|uniref:FAD-binding domain-containing protein n=1 Tax=Echinostoma caproni TaxID=27848 RepID=A0A3P8HZ34_9TREM|nr:unnamed protein product [Echinostoma caproni]